MAPEDREWKLGEGRRDIGLAFAGLVPVLIGAALVGVRGHIHNANVALILVVVVVAAAAIGGRAAGVAAALVAAVSFDFFHTQPYLRLAIKSADDVETTVLLLIVGLSVGHLTSAGMKARARTADRNVDIWRIHRVADRAARGEDAARVLEAAQDELTELLALGSCRFEAQVVLSDRPRLDRSGHLDQRVWHYRDGAFELPSEGVDLPVFGRGQQLGHFVLQPTPGVGVSLMQRVVAVAIADQVGAALAVSPTSRKGTGAG